MLLQNNFHSTGNLTRIPPEDHMRPFHLETGTALTADQATNLTCLHHAVSEFMHVIKLGKLLSCLCGYVWVNLHTLPPPKNLSCLQLVA